MTPINLDEYINKTDADLDDTPLTFGKYKGQTPDEISEEDPEYLLWLVREANFSGCSKALIQYCKQTIKEGE